MSDNCLHLFDARLFQATLSIAVKYISLILLLVKLINTVISFGDG